MAENASTETTAVVTETTATSATAPTSVDQLPEFAQKMIRDLRAEAASHRAAKGEAANAAKSETAQAYETKLADVAVAHDKTKDELAVAQLSYQKLLAVLEAGVPSDRAVTVAERLRGNTPEELAEDAKNVVGLFSMGSALDPSQGRGTSTGSSSDPAADAFANWMQNNLPR